MKRTVLLFPLIFLLFSCSNKSPEKVAVNFYNLLNEGKFEEAKKYATPSAIEYIDNIKSICTKSPGDSIPFELMDVQKVESPKEGDIATVNYKIGEFKSDIQLKWTDGRYKVVFTDELPSLRIVEYNSVDYCNLEMKLGKEVFERKFKGVRIRILNLVAMTSGEGAPYDINTNSSPINKYLFSYENGTHIKLLLHGKEVSVTGLGKNSVSSLLIFWLKIEEGHQIKAKSFYSSYNEEVYNSESLISIEGVVGDYFFSIKDCILINNK